MAFQRLQLYKAVELQVAGSGTLTFTFDTDIPAGWAQRATASIPAGPQVVAVLVRLPGWARGRHCRLTVSAASGASARIEGARVLARPLDPVQVFDWAWYAVPVKPTGQLFEAVALPVKRTSLDFIAVPIPVPGMPTEPVWVELPTDE